MAKAADLAQSFPTHVSADKCILIRLHFTGDANPCPGLCCKCDDYRRVHISFVDATRKLHVPRETHRDSRSLLKNLFPQASMDRYVRKAIGIDRCLPIPSTDTVLMANRPLDCEHCTSPTKLRATYSSWRGTQKNPPWIQAIYLKRLLNFQT
jgi:hypothetical protein